MTHRVAVVTGANRGIGAAIAVALARDGYRVAATARDSSTLADTVGAVTGAGGSRNPSRAAWSTRRRSPISPRRWGRSVRCTSSSRTPGSPRTAARAHARPVVGNPGGSGWVIAVSSMTGKRPLHGRTPYAIANMGIIGLMRTLAVELGPHGTRANTVCPGAVAGPHRRRHRSAGRHPRQQPRRGPLRVHGRIPLSRLVGADEVAAACAYLASDAASSVTGEDLNVSAGAVMY